MPDYFESATSFIFQDNGLTTNWLPFAASAGGSLTTINGQGGPAISLVSGTSGTDFAVSSSANTITLNIPTASGTNRGLLSSANWTTFNNKEPAITATTSADYYRGDKTFQPLDKTAVGLPNVDDTSDANKPVSTAQQAALDLKADLTDLDLKADLASPTFTGTVSGITKAMVGLGNVDDTSDADKPISDDTQDALDLKEDAFAVLPLAKGGTNKGLTAAAGGVIITDADSMEVLAAGTASKVLTSNGTSNPSWEDVRFPMEAQNGVTTTIASTIEVPESQLTERGGGKWLIETGNKNLLANPGFEHTTFSSGWTLTDGTAAAESSVVVEGLRSYKATLAAETLELYQDSEAHAAQFADGVPGVASVRIKTSLSGITVCPRLAGVTQTSPCATVNSDNKWMLYKAPFVFGATSNGIAIVSSGSITGDVYVDDAYLGTDAGIADVSIITPWQSYTPTYTSFGTVSPATNSCRWRQAGGSVDAECKATAGTITATEGRLSLPNGYTILSSLPSTHLAGQLVRTASAATYFNTSVLAEPGASYVVFGSQSSTTDAMTKTSTSPVSTGNTFSIKFSVPVNELAGSTQVFASQCGANCENVLSAKISSADVVSDENVPWINGNCTNAGAGFATCIPDSGTFTATPNCTCVAESNGECNYRYTSSSATSLVFSTDASDGTSTNMAFAISCQKQGADYQSSRTIVGSFKEVVTAPGITKPKTCYYAFGGASATLASPTECTTGTCVEVFDSCGTVTPPAWATVANYTNITFASGTFANNSFVDCDCKAFDTSAGSRKCHPYLGDSTWSTTSNGGLVLNVVASDIAGGPSTAYVLIECKGQAP